MKKFNITKQFLIKEYIENKKSMEVIAQNIGCSRRTISNYLNKYNISIRTCRELTIGKKNPNYKHGETLKKHFCQVCKIREISYPTFKYGKKMCIFCSNTGVWGTKYIDGRCSKQYYCKEPNCNNKISLNNWKDGKGRCLSCAAKIRAAKWQNGISKDPYSQDWTKELKEQIRKRDNYTCQLCNKTQKQSGKTLNVHHIDYDKKNCKEDNLTSLCNSCHTRTNAHRDYWTSYFSKRVPQLVALL